MTDKLTWEDVIAVGKLMGVEVQKVDVNNQHKFAVAVRHPDDYYPTYYADPKSAMDEVYFLSTRGARKWKTVDR